MKRNINNSFFDTLIKNGAPQSMIDKFYHNKGKTPSGFWKDISDKAREVQINENPFIDDLELDQDGIYKVKSN